MADQFLSTTVLLDAALTGGYEDAFSSASKLQNDLKRDTNALERQLKSLGKESDELDKIGESSVDLRKDMRKLERVIKSNERAIDKFGASRRHFRNARIGVSNLKDEIGGIAGAASKAALGVAGIATAAAVGLKPSEETLEFGDQLARIRVLPEMDEAKFNEIEDQLLDLSVLHVDIELPELAGTFNMLRKEFGVDGAQALIPDIAAFQSLTGQSLTDEGFANDFFAIMKALNVDTVDDQKQLLEILTKGVTRMGLRLGNIDAGDLGTLIEAYGEDLTDPKLQEALLVSLQHKSLDSEQFADKFREYLTKFNEATFVPDAEFSLDTGLADLDKRMKTEAELVKNRELFAKYNLGDDSTLLDLAKTYIQLDDTGRKQLIADLDKPLGGAVLDVLISAPKALEKIIKDAERLAHVDIDIQAEAEVLLNTWPKVWKRIGESWSAIMVPLQKEFATAFGPPIVAVLESLRDFIKKHKVDIANFFTGIRDGITPIVGRVAEAVKAAWPTIKQFATEVWGELRRHWDTIAPVAGFLADKVWGLAKAITGFVTDNPKLVATLIIGAGVWKAYKIASGGVQAVFDGLSGVTSLLQGHFHRLHSTAMLNQMEMGKTGKVAKSTGRKFLDMGKDMLATKFPRFASLITGIGSVGKAAIASIPSIAAMGAGLWTALAPALPFIAAGAAIAGIGILIYKNWDPLKAFFVKNFETIRTAALIMFPPLGLFLSFAKIIKDNWEPLKAFFSELWETIKLAGQVAYEGIKFLALSTIKFVKDVWGGITEFFGGLWGGVQGVFMDSPLAPIFEGMVSAVKAIVSPLVGFFGNIWGSISDMAGEALGWITDKLEKMNEWLGGVLGWLRDRNKELSDDIGLETNITTDQTTTTIVKADPIPQPAAAVAADPLGPTGTLKPEVVTTETTIRTEEVNELKSMGVKEIDLTNTSANKDLMPSDGIGKELVTSVVKTTTDSMQVMGAEKIEFAPGQIRYTDAPPPPAVSSYDSHDQYDTTDNSVQSTTQTQTGGKTEIVNNINIYQQPGESNEDLAERIARIVEEQVDKSQARFITQ